MAIPLAVSPGTLTPGVYLVVDLLAGAASPSSGVLRIALLGGRSSVGTLTLDTEVRAGGGVDTAATAFGQGTPAHLAAKQLYARFPAAQVDFAAPILGAGLGTLTITFAGVPSANQNVLLDIMGREIAFAWLVGESVGDIQTKCVTAINELDDDLFATAVAGGGAGEVDINAKFAGNEGDDILVSAVFGAAQTGSETLVGAATPTLLAGGTTDPDYANVLAAIAGKEYAMILPCLSNADMGNVATENNFNKCIDHIELIDSGLDAKLQQVTAGMTTTIALASAMTIHANGGKNSPVGECMLCINGRGLPAELGGREVGGWLKETSLDPAANRIGEDMSSYIGAVDVDADRPTTAESESALGAGVSLISYTAGGTAILLRAITTHSQTDAGAPDRRLLDIQNVSATYIVTRDLRSALPQEFPNAKITQDTEAGEDPPPKGVIEERDIKAFIVSRLRFWQGEGVITRASLDAAIAGGTLIVQINASDSTQVDIVLPFSIVPPLAKFGLAVQRVPN